MNRRNVLITGSPCCGKSTLAELVAQRTGFNWIDISEVVKRENLIESFDVVYDCSVIDEAKVIDFLTPMAKKGGNIIEYHECVFFPESWFSAIFVPRTEASFLGYKGRKLNDNMECEIFEVILEDAKEAFNPVIVHELRNNVESDLERNICAIVQISVKGSEGKCFAREKKMAMLKCYSKANRSQGKENLKSKLCLSK